MSATSLRLVEGHLNGQVEGAGCGAEPDRARLRQGLDHAARHERKRRSRSPPCRPARSASTSRSASAACRAAASSRSTGRNPPARRRSRCTPSPRRRRRGGICGFIDAEHALDAGYARKLGVKLDDLLISQPDTGEQALEIADTLVRSGAIDILVVDSVAALTPRAEIEGEMGDQLPGLQARLMSQALRKLTASICALQHDGHLHQPDPHEDRRHVRQPRDHDRRQCAEVLRLGPPRHPPHRRDQGARRGGRQPDPRQGRQEQAGARRSSRSSSTSCTARASPRPAS